MPLKLTAGDIANTRIARAKRIDQGEPLVEFAIAERDIWNPRVQRLEAPLAPEYHRGPFGLLLDRSDPKVGLSECLSE